MAAPTDTPACPRCRRPAGADRCPTCGLVQTGEQVSRLRAVVDRLETIARAQYALTAEAAVLRQEQTELLRALSAGPVPAGRQPAPESRPEVVRDVLLWLGSALVAVAALIFSLFAWRRLGDTGRAGLLFAMTFLAAGGAWAMLKRLPATAEALGGLTLALFLVDWFVLRKAGVAGGLSGEAWWALGTGMAAGLSVAAAPWLRLQAVAAAVLVQVSAVLFVTRFESDWTVALGLALVAVPLAAAAGRLSSSRAWVAAAVVLGCGTALMETAALMVVEDNFVLGDWTTSLRLAGVLLAVALAPAGAVLTVGPGSRARRDGLVAAGAASVLGAVAMVAAAVWTTPASLLAAVAVLGAGGVGVALVVPAALRPGSFYAGAACLGVGVLRLLEPMSESVATALSWLADPWGGSPGGAAAAGAGLPFDAALVALLALAGAAALVLVRGRDLAPAPVAYGAAAAAAVGLVTVAPLAAGGPVGAATLVTAAGALAALGAAAVADRRGWQVPSLALAATGAVLGATATGWALATEGGTVAFLASLAAGGGVTAAVARTDPFRQALASVAAVAAAGEGAAITLSAGGSVADAGVVVAMVGGAALVAGALWRNRAAEGVALEGVGAANLALGAALAATDQPWLAITLTAATAWLMLAGTKRSHWLLAGAGTSVAATWAWLAVFDVGLVEAYTLPAAGVALAAGVVARRRRRALDSWTAMAPGLTVGLLPSVALVVLDGGLARPLAVTAAALAVLLAGARTRLQAPMVLGAGALLAVAIDALWPVAARVPRWAAIGAIGLALLWLGATAEHRLAQLKDLGRRFRDLEPDGPVGQSA